MGYHHRTISNCSMIVDTKVVTSEYTYCVTATYSKCGTSSQFTDLTVNVCTLTR